MKALTDSPTLRARLELLILLLCVAILPVGCGAMRAASDAQNGKLAGYLAAIALLSVVGYALVICIRPLVIDRDSGLGLAILILAGIWVLKQSVLPLFPGFGVDVGSYTSWAQRVADVGPARTYEPGYFLDYPPGYLYALWAAGALAKIFSTGGDTTRLLVESPALIADFVLALVMFAYLRRSGRGVLAYAGMLMVALNPALLFESVIWGQSDSVPALLMLLSVLMILEGECELSWALAAIGVLVKPQVLLFLPVLGLWTLMRVEPRRWFGAALGFILALVIGAAPFQKDHAWSWLPSLYFSTTSFYHETSVNAFNFMALAAGLRQQDTTTIFGFPSFWLGMSLLAVVYAGVAWTLWRRASAQNLFFCAFIALLGSFVFAPRMHERYLYPALVFIIPIALEDPTMLAVFGALSLTFLFNLAYIKRTLESAQNFLDANDTLAMLASAANVIAFGLAAPYGATGATEVPTGAVGAIRAFGAGIRNAPALAVPARVEEEVTTPLAWLRVDTVVITALVVFAAAIHFWHIGKPAEIVFDEVHFVGQARHYLHNEQFLDPHPPLAKLLFALSIWIFGDHPWSWRVPNAIIGTALVGITYLLGRRMLHSRLAATLAAGLIACDGMFLVNSRIAVLDITYLTCAAVSYLMLFRFLETPDWYSRRRTLVWMGLALGLCLGAKLYIPAVTFLLVVGALAYILWTGAGTSSAHKNIVPAPLRFRLIGGSLTLISAVGAFVYIVVFLPHVFLGWWGGIADLFKYYKEVVGYEQSVSSATHPYSSPWWSWPLMLRPVACWQDFPKTGDVSTIWWGGNPASWWAALTAIFVIGLEAIERGTLWRTFMTIGYVAYLIIWIPIGRTLFVYHYMPSVYLAYLALAAVLAACWRGTAEQWTHLALLLTLAPVFFLGLPYGWNVTAYGALVAGYAVTVFERPQYAGKFVFVTFVTTVLVVFVYFLPVWMGIPIARSGYYARMWLQGPGLRNWI